MKNLLAVNKVKTIEKLLHNLLDLSQAELDIHVGEEARQVVLAEVEHQVECGLVRQISITLTMFSCRRSCRILISLNAVIGNPSFSFSIKTFFSAMTLFLFFLSLALNTSPKVPWPLACFSYLDTSSQKGKSNCSIYWSRNQELDPAIINTYPGKHSGRVGYVWNRNNLFWIFSPGVLTQSYQALLFQQQI